MLVFPMTWTLNKKIGFVLLANSFIAVITACVILLAVNIRINRDIMVSDLVTLTDVIGHNIRTALSLNSKEEAREMLHGLAARSSVLSASVYDHRKKIFACYKCERSHEVSPDGARLLPGTVFTGSTLRIVKEITADGHVMGYIELVDDIGALRGIVRISLIVLGAVLLGALVLVSFSPIILKKYVSRPILDLAVKASSITAHGDYSIRVKTGSSDEIGLLGKAFNQMLDRIEKQNDELKTSKRLLELSVEDRTRELMEAQEKLLRTEKLATIGQLSGSIAHELRTPLSAIKGSGYFLRSLLKDLSEPRIIKHLNIIDSEIFSADRIISDVLFFGRMRPPMPAENDINTIIGEVLNCILIRNNIELVYARGAGLPPVMIDDFQIKQVMNNVIDNAMQSIEGAGKITVKTYAEPGWLVTEVSDTGCGIRKEDLGKIFEPLFSTKIRGTGLGLAICKNIMDMHRGVIDVASESGKGSSFYIKIPIGGCLNGEG
ncbi:MAG: HAMP domain-containing protein [Candidatus Omnitrophica bacterium]|nr:HAMP domain-containing protein [Candidatus Omnitrophota bacterium]